MSCGCGLGETSSWWQVTASESEVFVWRCQMLGADIRTSDDAMAIVHGAAQAPNSPLDIRGIAVKPSAGGFSVDVVWTTRQWAANPMGLLFPWPNAKDVAQYIAADSAVRARFPQLEMKNYEWLQLVGPAGAVDFWRAHPILWDRALGDGKIGGPTQAFADRTGTYSGAADDGAQLQPMPGSGKQDIGEKKTSSSTTTMWIVGGIGAALVLWYFASKERK